MKKFMLILIIALFTMSSCSRYVNTGGGGCGVWMPKKFGNDKSHMRRMNWVNNPKSGRYHSLGF